MVEPVAHVGSPCHVLRALLAEVLVFAIHRRQGVRGDVVTHHEGLPNVVDVLDEPPPELDLAVDVETQIAVGVHFVEAVHP